MSDRKTLIGQCPICKTVVAVGWDSPETREDFQDYVISEVSQADARAAWNAASECQCGPSKYLARITELEEAVNWASEEAKGRLPEWWHDVRHKSGSISSRISVLEARNKELLEGIKSAWLIFDDVEDAGDPDANMRADEWQNKWADVAFPKKGGTNE